jgi:hypothetical protein
VDFSRPIGMFSTTPPSLSNLTNITWRVRTEHGERFEILHGENLSFVVRSRVDTGDCVFETQPPQ